jgi:hypothetical protein
MVLKSVYADACFPHQWHPVLPLLQVNPEFSAVVAAAVAVAGFEAVRARNVVALQLGCHRPWGYYS